MNNFELHFYTDDGDDIVIPLTNWQIQAIQQLLGLSVESTDDGIEFSYFPKDVVSKRLKKMGILVTPEQYRRMNSIDSDI